MGGRLAPRPEVGRRPHEAGPEMVLPDSIHHYPRGKRIVGAGQPIGKFATAAPCADRRLTFSTQRPGKACAERLDRDWPDFLGYRSRRRGILRA